MSTAAIKLHDILVEKGVDKTTAREAVNEFVTREEAVQTLATKQDIADVHRSISRTGYTVIGIVLAGVAILLQVFSNPSV